MSYYVLTDNTARGIKNFLNSQISHPTSVQRYGSVAAYKDNYPHPYEIRWSENMISGGGYAIWLPPKCLQVDGTNISPEKWFPYNGKICADVSSDWWYRLSDKVIGLGSAVNVDELSSFNLYLNVTMNEVIMSLSAEDAWYGSNGFVHIAEINNYRSKPNVKSNLILDNTRHRPFDLVKDPIYTGSVAHQWIMRYCMFEDRGTTIELTDGFRVPAPSVTTQTSLTFYGLRLVEVDNSEWLVDRVEMQNTSDFAALNALSIGEQLSQPVSSNEVVATYPLYIQGPTGSIIYDLRDAWYNIQGIDAADEKSVALTGDVLSNSLSSLSTEYHLHHFHDRENDLSVGAIISGYNPPTWSVRDYDLLLRHRGQQGSGTNTYQNELFYFCLQDLVDNLSSGGGGSSGPISADQLSSIPSPGMFAWTESTRTMGPGGCMFGRQWVTATGTGSGKADGLYQLRCSIANTGNTACSVVSDATLGQAPTTQFSWIPIYQITNGKITADYRGAFVVPCYE